MPEGERAICKGVDKYKDDPFVSHVYDLFSAKYCKLWPFCLQNRS